MDTIGLRIIIESYKSTIIGDRDSNQDRILSKRINSNLFISLICDGMGKYEGGEEAAEISITTISQYFNQLKDFSNIGIEIYNSIELAHKKIVEISQIDENKSMMGTTLALVIFHLDYFIVANVGDSRVYLVRNDNIFQLTQDHVLAQRIQFKDYNYKPGTSITKAVGINNKWQPFISLPFKLFSGDKFLLCSDGLYEYINDDILLSRISELSPSVATRELLDIVKKNSNEDKDKFHQSFDTESFFYPYLDNTSLIIVNASFRNDFIPFLVFFIIALLIIFTFFISNF